MGESNSQLAFHCLFTSIFDVLKYKIKRGLVKSKNHPTKSLFHSNKSQLTNLCQNCITTPPLLPPAELHWSVLYYDVTAWHMVARGNPHRANNGPRRGKELIPLLGVTILFYCYKISDSGSTFYWGENSDVS